MNPKRVRMPLVALLLCAMPLLLGSAWCIDGEAGGQEHSLCEDMTWCTDLEWKCNPLPNAVTCDNANTVTYFRFLTEAQYGTCKEFSYVNNVCPYCTIGIVCATGRGYAPSALVPDDPCVYDWCGIVIYRNGKYCAG